jgi:serine protease
VLVAVLALTLAAAGGAAAGRPGSVEVTYSSQAALLHALDGHPAKLIRVVGPLHVAEVRPSGDARVFVRAVRGEPGITSARLTARRVVAAAPAALTLGLVSTPLGGAYEWQYFATGADRVPASVRAAARATTIAVLDTGVDASAPALAGRLAGQYDVRSSRKAAPDLSGHGTFVASLAAGGDGIAGVGGDARLLSVKIGDGPQFDDVDVAAGIVYAVKHGARIVNLSFAGPTRSAVEVSAVRYAAQRGVLLVAAAGNDALAGNAPEYPAALLEPGGLGLSVGASDFAGNRAPFSEHGSFVSLAAPGASVFGALASRSAATAFPRTALPGVSAAGLYGFASGTSFAAPQVAGAAALVWAANPRLTAKQVASILEQSASGHGAWGPDLGYGVLDAAAAVDLAGTLAG